MRTRAGFWTAGFVLAIVLLPAAVSAAQVPLEGAPAGAAVFPSVLPAAVLLNVNWSGYVVTGHPGSVTFVQGSWKQPAVACTSTDRYSDFLVGIDGYLSAPTAVVGTHSSCLGGVAHYGANYWLNPSGANFSLTIHSGDLIRANISYNLSSATYKLVVSDLTTNRTATHVGVRVGTARTSAEWVVASTPIGSSVLPLADFHIVRFGTDATGIAHTCEATVSGHTHFIGGFTASSVHHLDMASTVHVRAASGALTPDDSSFNVTWQHAS